MSTRDRRSQRIRDQLRARPNPRSGQAMLAPRSLQEQLKQVYGEEPAGRFHHEALPVAAELTRLVRRRR